MTDIGVFNLKVSGMRCAGCSNSVKNALLNLEGVLSADVNHESGTARIEISNTNLTIDMLAKIIRDTGFDVENH